MKLEIGKYYKTRDGRKAGPIEESAWDGAFMARIVGEKWYYLYEMTGRHGDGGCKEPCIKNRPQMDIVAEWEEPMGTEMKTWGKMTDAEKGALLLAHHEGKEIECFSESLGNWITLSILVWYEDSIYRVKKVPIKNMEVVYMYFEDGCNQYIDVYMSDPTHKITFDTIDGVPDCSSIKMEKV